MEAFLSHWRQIQHFISTPVSLPHRPCAFGTGSSFRENTALDTVLNNAHSIVVLLSNEPPAPIQGPNGEAVKREGPIFGFALNNHVLTKVEEWLAQNCGSKADDVKVELLNNYRIMLVHAKQPLFTRREMTESLLKLISDCSTYRSPVVETNLLKLLYDLACMFQCNLSIFRLFASLTLSAPLPHFTPLTLLLPYMYKEGELGDCARKAIYLLVSVASIEHAMVKFIAEKSNFCSILATGISATYSALPSRLPCQYNSMPSLTTVDCPQVPFLYNFIQAVQFTNSLCNVSHKTIRENIRDFILAGFLCPIVLPAISQTSPVEAAAASAYLDLFIRTINESSLMKCTVHFILTTKVEGQPLINIIINRIICTSETHNTTAAVNPLSTVSLLLISTLINLRSEDIMLELFLAYLLPGNHVIKSQLPSLADADIYGKSVERLISLVPSACRKFRHRPLVVVKDTGQPMMNVQPEQTLDNNKPRNSVSFANDLNPRQTRGTSLQRNVSAPLRKDRSPPPEAKNGGGDYEIITLSQFESSYFDYLQDAKGRLGENSDAIFEWSCHYSAARTANCHSPRRKVVRRSGRVKEDLWKQQMNMNGGGEMSAEEFLDSFDLDEIAKGVAMRPQVPWTPQMMMEETKLAEMADEFLNDPFIKQLERGSTVPDLLIDSQPDMKQLAGRKIQQPLSLLKLDSITRLELLGSPPPDNHSLPDSGQSTPAVEFAAPRLPSLESPSSRQSLCDIVIGTVNYSLSDKEEPPFSRSLNSGQSLRIYTRNHTHAHAAPPSVGPCMETLLAKLELMTENDLNCNLVLTGILTSLAAYSLPLLTSYLLSSHLVFQPGIKTLYQVLAKLQQKVDTIAESVDNFHEMLLRARYYFANYERLQVDSLEQYLSSDRLADACSKVSHLTDNNLSPVSVSYRVSSAPSNIIVSQVKPRGKRSGLFALLFGRGGSTGGGKRADDTSQVFYRSEESLQMEVVSVRAVVAAIILEEFLKELAALAQEHSLYTVDPGHF